MVLFSERLGFQKERRKKKKKRVKSGLSASLVSLKEAADPSRGPRFPGGSDFLQSSSKKLAERIKLAREALDFFTETEV